jgi:plastocyanin
MRSCQRSAVAVTMATFLSVAACGGSSSGYPTGSGNPNPPPPGNQPPPGSTSNSILVQNNRFNPSSTTVPVGTTVTWTWDACSDDGYGGQTCVEHNVTFDVGGTGSTTRSSGSYSRQFNTAGTFGYRCTVHGSAMTGQVVVN